MTGTAEAKVRRYTFLETFLFVALIIILVTAAVFAMVAYERQDTISDSTDVIRDSTQRVECIARLTADFQGYVGDALAAPPAPNPERTEAVEGIARTAALLHGLERSC